MIWRALEEREVDAVVTGIMAPLADHLQAETLYTASRVVVASTENPWSRRRRVGLADLMNEPWALPPPNSPGWPLMVDEFRTAGLDLPRATVITYTDVARLALVAKGRFLTIAGTSAFIGWHTAIKALPVKLESSHVSVGVMTLKNRTLTPVTQLFIDCAREIAKPLAAGKSVLPRRRPVQDA
jgi:DNA-binding transcriptional LysR family regulator